MPSTSELIEFIESIYFDLDDEFKSKLSTIVDNFLNNHKIDKYYLKPFNLDTCQPLLDIFTTHKVAYFNVNFDWKDNKIELYPILADYQFFRVFDIFATYQALEYYLCNILVAPDDPYIEPVSDKIKAESKGFDKFSFRKEKQL